MIGGDEKIKRLSNLMLFSNLISTLFYAMSYPYIYAETCKIVPTYYISIEQFLSCIGTIIFCWLWNKYSDKLFVYYGKIIVTEIIFDVILFADSLLRSDLKFYFLFNVIIYSVITRNMICGGTKMRAIVNPTEKSREQYDNNSNIVVSIATLVGTSLSLILAPNLKTLFIFALIGNTFDNFLFMYIYHKITKEIRRNNNGFGRSA